MTTWNARQYLRFSEERIRPCRDLVARVSVDHVHRVIDLGCGPGNSTAVLAQRWPGAAITGLDNSPEMLQEARAADPDRTWIEGDISTWAAAPGDSYDVVFSNAALQWVPDHAVVLAKLLVRVSSGGALAIQMPAYDSPAHRLSRTMAASQRWSHRFPGGPAGDWNTQDISYYYDLLAPLASNLDFWETEYLHVMDAPGDIVEWYKGTGLRPFLAALKDGDERNQFLAEYLQGLENVYPRRRNGRVLFPFGRIFLVAYR
jgi:trans-aconitate 2-methyltransferase